jgi:ParB family chromosome partitioning protein
MKVQEVVSSKEALVPVNLMGGKTQSVQVALLEENPFQPRKDYGELSGLVMSIGTRGLFPGALVAREHKGKFQLLYGGRRLKAVQQLRWDKVPVTIVRASDSDMRYAGVVENLHRKDLTSGEQAQAIAAAVEALIEEKKLGRAAAYDAVAAQIGKSLDWVKKQSEFIRNAPTALKTAVSEGKIGLRTAMRAQQSGQVKEVLAEVAKPNGKARLDTVEKTAKARKQPRKPAIPSKAARAITVAADVIPDLLKRYDCNSVSQALDTLRKALR